MLYLILICIFSMIFSSCASAIKNVENNIFQYAIEKNRLLPKQADYSMSIEEVLEAKGLNEKDIEQEDEKNSRIINPIQINGLSENIKEVFYFYEGKLVTVLYAIVIEKSKFEEVCKRLDKQAEDFLSSDMKTTIGKIQNEELVIWEDNDGNTVVVSFPTTNDTETRVVRLELHSSRS